MKAYVFPGQGAQFVGMCRQECNTSEIAKKLLEQANEILGFRITDVMFEGTDEDLVQTKVTQPAIFLHSIVRAQLHQTSFAPDAVAGHSLGEFSALVAARSLSFEDGLVLVQKRALAMQKACEMQESTMAAILGLEEEVVEKICASVDGVVVPANYNCPGQLVISGSVVAVRDAVQRLQAAGAKRAVLLAVGGAFHSPLMQPAREELQKAIEATSFSSPTCPIYQNVTATAVRDAGLIQENLIQQLTAPVKWTQTIRQMLKDGVKSFVEVGGNGKVLRGMIVKVDRKIPVEAI